MSEFNCLSETLNMPKVLNACAEISLKLNSHTPITVQHLLSTSELPGNVILVRNQTPYHASICSTKLTHIWPVIITLLELVFTHLYSSFSPSSVTFYIIFVFLVTPTAYHILSWFLLLLLLLPSKRFRSYLVINGILMSIKYPRAENPQLLGDWNCHLAASGGPDGLQLLSAFQTHGGVLKRKPHVVDIVGQMKKKNCIINAGLRCEWLHFLYEVTAGQGGGLGRKISFDDDTFCCWCAPYLCTLHPLPPSGGKCPLSINIKSQK